MAARDEAAGKDRRAAENGEGAYLRALGERIREARARRGMTRKILARDSKVSERYLAQLEAGQGDNTRPPPPPGRPPLGLAPADPLRAAPARPGELHLPVHA